MNIKQVMQNTSELMPDVAQMVLRNPKVALELLPSALEGFILQNAKSESKIEIQNKCPVSYNWDYKKADEPSVFNMIYKKAKKGQWDGDDLAWDTDVDPLDPDKCIFPKSLIPFYDTKIWPKDKKLQNELLHSSGSWVLSQFLHGEQGAMHVSCQTVEVNSDIAAKLYGATQVMDEARHVEVFHRYLDTKLQKSYDIDDNLFTVLHYLSGVGEWDLKYLGMQIMVEGLALGAFTTLYKYTKEPLMKQLLKGVIADEARHVHYGVAALEDYYHKSVTPAKKREREDWAFEIARLLRNRFLFTEIYHEYFAHKITRSEWDEIILNSGGLSEFRHSMFHRMIPNLKKIGLLSDRMRPRYEELGLLKYEHEKSADQLTENELQSAAG